MVCALPVGKIKSGVQLKLSEPLSFPALELANECSTANSAKNYAHFFPRARFLGQGEGKCI